MNLRSRVITLLGLTSLVITMVTINQYDPNSGQLYEKLVTDQTKTVDIIRQSSGNLISNSSHKIIINFKKINLINTLIATNARLNRTKKSVSSLQEPSSTEEVVPKSMSYAEKVKSLRASGYLLVKQASKLTNPLLVKQESERKTLSVLLSNKTQSAIKDMTSESTPKPKPFYNDFDLKTTETMKINKELICDSDLGSNLDLMVIVLSAVHNFAARQAIRQTWGKFAVERGARLLFLIGDTLDSNFQELVEMEDKEFQDILQGNFIDNYYNLTLKTITMMKLMSEQCYKVKYLLKIDDDVVVNMQQLLDYLEMHTNRMTIIGNLAQGWKPHREPENKWYVPEEAYPKKMFPPFVTGPAYVITGDALKALYRISIQLTPIYLEDVYMTGIVAEKAAVKRVHMPMMCNVPVIVNECTFHKLMTSHKHAPENIIDTWHLVYSKSAQTCANNSVKVSCIRTDIKPNKSVSGVVPQKKKLKRKIRRIRKRVVVKNKTS